MSLSIVTNISSLIAQENLRVNNDFQGQTIQRLTSGLRINQSGDDAAGLAVANKFRSDVAELSQGVRNANDGVSQLQIVDGGLNNISKMLDRMKTLATQSASTTFSGSRSTLNTEFAQLIVEINRQAANMKLNANGDLLTQISVYIGGGNTQANAKVGIDLSNAQVDSTGLGVSGATVAAGGVTFGAVGAATSAQVFTVDADGQQYTFTTKTAAAAGSVDAVVTDLNNQMTSKGLGISASIQDDSLVFSSSKGFRIESDATADGLGPASTAKLNDGVYNATGAVYAAPGSGDETVTVTTSAGTKTITIDAAADIDAAISSFNAAAKDLGVYAFKDGAGTSVYVASSSAFTLTATGGDNDKGLIGGVGADVASLQSSDPTKSSQVDYNALNAINSLTSAVSLLGSVQGIVGAGQNKLQYAIQLAQSQIAAYSAAESRIRDADIAAEAANLTKAQVMQQASLAAMAQANAAPQAVLALLRG